MRFLADESCHFPVICALCAAGHDVLAISEIQPGALDDVILDHAVREGRILLTQDKDFGELAYTRSHPSGTVILVRFPSRARQALTQAVLDLVNREGEDLLGSFVVVQPGRVRISRSPGDC